jgi:cbb3-type cytochrome oxidase maturation protein
MSFLLVTVPVSLLVAGILLALVIHAVRTGAFDDWEGPAARHLSDADQVPELPEGADPARRRSGLSGEP